MKGFGHSGCTETVTIAPDIKRIKIRGGPEDTELDRCDGVLAVCIGAASSLPVSTALASGSTLLHTGGERSKGLGATRLERTGTQSSDEAPSMM